MKYLISGILLSVISFSLGESKFKKAKIELGITEIINKASPVIKIVDLGTDLTSNETHYEHEEDDQGTITFDERKFWDETLWMMFYITIVIEVYCTVWTMLNLQTEKLKLCYILMAVFVFKIFVLFKVLKHVTDIQIE